MSQIERLGEGCTILFIVLNTQLERVYRGIHSHHCLSRSEMPAR